jgi:hypothetical protein
MRLKNNKNVKTMEIEISRPESKEEDSLSQESHLKMKPLYSTRNAKRPQYHFDFEFKENKVASNEDVRKSKRI